MVRITMIINPREPEGLALLRSQVERLRGDGHEVSPLLTFERGDGRRMARAAAAGGADLVIAAGGDGTLNEVANGLVEHVSGGGSRAPRMGILPLGTANDLAGSLTIPDDILLALEIATGDNSLDVDVGIVEDRCFLNVSTGGIGAEATEETSSDSKRALGALSYMVTGVRKFVALEVSRARFTCGDEEVFHGPFFLFAVGNSTRTGGGNLLTPRAEMRDGLLDLCIVRETSRMEFLKLLPELRAGTHVDHPAVVYRQAREVRVESEVALSVNADGEPLEGRSFHYRINDHRLALMVP